MSLTLRQNIIAFALTTTIMVAGTGQAKSPPSAAERYEMLLQRHDEIQAARMDPDNDETEAMTLFKELHKVRFAMRRTGYNVPSNAPSISEAAGKPEFSRFNFDDPRIQRTYHLACGNAVRMQQYLDWQQRRSNARLNRRALVVQHAQDRARYRRARLGIGPAPEYVLEREKSVGDRPLADVEMVPDDHMAQPNRPSSPRLLFSALVSALVKQLNSP